MEEISINEIMDLIPHRYPFLLVDKIIEIKQDKSIIGIKNVTFNEQYFVGHFPNNPVMPGVLIVEALAQVSAILVSRFMESRKDKDVLLASIEEAKFRKIVRPGDTVYLYSTITRARSPIWKCSCRAEVNGEVATECLVTAVVKDNNTNL